MINDDIDYLAERLHTKREIAEDIFNYVGNSNPAVVIANFIDWLAAHDDTLLKENDYCPQCGKQYWCPCMGANGT